MRFMKQPPVLSDALLKDLHRYIDAYYTGEQLSEMPDMFLSAKCSAFQEASAAQEYREVAAPMLAPPKRRPAEPNGLQSAAQEYREEAAPMLAPPKRRPSEPNGLQDILKTAESSFSEHLLSLLQECGEKDSAVYRRAGISRQLFHQILNKKDYQPTKSTAIQLALGLRLDVSGTQTLLGKAGYALTRSSKADLVVQYFIERKEYSIVTINAALYDCGLPLLKTGFAV
jgi:hypothetical protein